jgi:hypothetical protein
VNKETLSDYAIVVHGLKGSSYGIFADMIAQSAEGLEHAARSGDFHYVQQHNQTFLDATEKLLDDLDAMLAEMDAGDQKPTKDKPDTETLTALLTACENYDMDGVDAAMTTITHYKYDSDDGLVDWLRENVEKMNFAEIKEKLSALIHV